MQCGENETKRSVIWLPGIQVEEMDGFLNSSNSSTAEKLYDARPVGEIVVQASVMGIIILCAVTGNLLILIAIYIDRTLQTITNAFVINLACADLALSLIGMPFTMASSVTYNWIFGTLWCNVHGMVNSLFCIASILTLAAVSVDRYVAISFPLRYPSWMTRKTATASILYIWFHSLMVALLPVFAWSKYTFIVSESICTVHWSYNAAFTIFLFTVCFFVPLGVLLFTYFRIYRTAQMHSKRVIPTTGRISLAKKDGQLNGRTMNTINSSTGDLYDSKVSVNSSNSVNMPNQSDSSESRQNNADINADTLIMNNFATEKTSDSEGQGKGNSEHRTPTIFLSEFSTSQDFDNSSGLLGNCAANGLRKNSKKLYTFQDRKIRLPPLSSTPTKTLGLHENQTKAWMEKKITYNKNSETNSSHDLPRNRKKPMLVTDVNTNSAAPNRDCDINREDSKLNGNRSAPPSPLMRTRISINVISESSIRFLRKQRNEIERANERRMHRDTKAAKTLLIVVGTFILCWTPHFIGIFCLLTPGCRWPDRFFAITTWLAMLNSACNPIIYGVMSRQFRKRFKQILKCESRFF